MFFMRLFCQTARASIPIGRRGHFDQRGAVTVSGRQEKSIGSHNDWLCDIDAVIGDPGEFPEQRTVFHSQSHYAARADVQDLPAAGKSGQLGRGVGLLVIQCLPDRVSSQSVIGDHRFALRSAGQDDHFIVHDEGRGGHAPLNVFGLVVGKDVAGPDPFSGLGIKAAEFAGGAERIEAPFMPGGCRTGTVAAQDLAEFGVPAVNPLFSPGIEGVGCDNLPLPALFDGENQSVGRHHRSIAAAHRTLPQERELAFRPVGEDPGFGIDAVALGAAELRPVRATSCGLWCRRRRGRKDGRLGRRILRQGGLHQAGVCGLLLLGGVSQSPRCVFGDF